jgi:hypothetical protein
MIGYGKIFPKKYALEKKVQKKTVPALTISQSCPAG